MDRAKTNRTMVSYVTGGWGVVGLVLLGAQLLASCGQAASEGGSAPDFSFHLYQGQEELGGSQFLLSDMQGPVVLNFWAGLCPPCRGEMPDLQEFYDDFASEVILVGVDVGRFTGLGNQADAQKLLAELGVTYPAGFTENNQVVRSYRVLSMPSTVFIDGEGDVFRIWVGALDSQILSEITREMIDKT